MHEVLEMKWEHGVLVSMEARMVELRPSAGGEVDDSEIYGGWGLGLEEYGDEDYYTDADEEGGGRRRRRRRRKKDDDADFEADDEIGRQARGGAGLEPWGRVRLGLRAGRGICALRLPMARPACPASSAPWLGQGTTPRGSVLQQQAPLQQQALCSLMPPTPRQPRMLTHARSHRAGGLARRSEVDPYYVSQLISEGVERNRRAEALRAGGAAGSMAAGEGSGLLDLPWAVTFTDTSAGLAQVVLLHRAALELGGPGPSATDAADLVAACLEHQVRGRGGMAGGWADIA